MGVNRIPLTDRLDRLGQGCASDPAFVRCAIRTLAQMPLREYFGPHKNELELLSRELRVEGGAGSMTYMQAAVQAARIPYQAEREYAAFLLAIPILRSSQQHTQ